MSEEAYWGVAQVSAPALVETSLARDGFETYRPRIKVDRRAEPLWPGYLIVKIRVRWWPVRWCPGVVRLLMNGEVPARLADEIVNDLKAREHRGFVKLQRYPGVLAKGDKIRVTAPGNFTGFTGIFEGMSGQDRQRVLLQMMGQWVSAIMPAGSVERVDDSGRPSL
jgi:transcription antitermination factor NusG